MVEDSGDARGTEGDPQSEEVSLGESREEARNELEEEDKDCKH